MGMALPGGAADKLGNAYERRFTVLAMLELLMGQATSLRVEVPGDAGAGAEFRLRDREVTKWTQSKRQRGSGPWTLSALLKENFLQDWLRKPQDGDVCTFSSTTSADELRQLCECAVDAVSLDEFEAQFLTADRRRKFEQLRAAWSVDNAETYRLLKRIRVVTIDDERLDNLIETKLTLLVTGNLRAARRVLLHYADEIVHREVTAEDIWEFLYENGIEQRSAITIVPAAVDYPADSTALVDFHVRWFAGRQVEFDRIWEFLTDPTPGYLLVEAPSGFGKSALATQVVHRIRTGDWDGRAPNLVFFFVREQRREHTATAFLAAVNSQLMAITGKRLELPADLESLRAQFRTLWRAAIEKSQPLLLVVDGLDEAAGEPELSITKVLPDHLGPSTHVLVTSRPNPVAPEAVSLEHPLRSAHTMTLGPLTSVDIAAQLLRIGEDLVSLAAPIFTATAGEPFFVHQVCESVMSGGAAVVEELTNANGDVGDFSRHQFTQLNKAVSGDLTWRVLALLTVAHGPLTVAELVDALDEPLLAVDRALRPVMRYLLGRNEFELQHARLRAAVKDYLGTSRLADAGAVVRAWGARYARQNWPDHTPGYLVDRYLMHLDEDRDHSARVALVCPAWLRLTARRTGSYRMFADQMRAIAHSALDRDPPDVVAAVQCGLMLAAVRSASGRIPAGALRAMVRLSRVQEAVDHAFLQDGAVDRVAAFCAIARSLPPNTVELHNALDHAEEAVVDIRDPDSSYPGVLADLAAALVAAGRQDEAVELATRLANKFDDDRWSQLLEKATVDALAAANMYKRGADAATQVAGREPEDLFGADFAAFDSVQIAAGAARAWALAKNPAKAKALADSARNDARHIPVIEESVVGAGEAFIRITHGVEQIRRSVAESYAHLGDFSESVAVVEEMAYPWRRGEALIAVAEIAAEADEGAVAAELANRAVGEFTPERNREVLHQPKDDELDRLLGRAAAVLAETGHDTAAAGLLADLERRIQDRPSSSTLEQFIAKAATALAQTDRAADVSALLDQLTDPNLRRTTSAACAAALTGAGHRTEGSAVAHRLRAETQQPDSLSGLKQRPSWLGPLLRAFTALGDAEAANQLTGWVLTALQAESALTLGPALTLLDLAEQRAGTGHADAARKALKFAFRAVRDDRVTNDANQFDGYSFWVQAALVEHALGDRQNAKRYADRGLAEFRTTRSYLVPNAINHAQQLLEIGLPDHAREILRIGDRISSRTSLGQVGRHADVYANAFGEEWLRNLLTSHGTAAMSIYDDRLGLALGWFYLGDRARATEIVERFTYFEPDAESVRRWTEMVCEGAHLLLRMNHQKSALNAFTAAVNRHLAGRVGSVVFGEPLEQFHALLTASVAFLAELPDGSTSLRDVAWTVVETEEWMRHTM